MEAFVYCWTDKLTNKLYVGSHKGSVDDGYVCSSKYMLEQHKIRPTDFSRQIVAVGSVSDIRKLESKILQNVNAKTNEDFYNKHQNDGLFFDGWSSGQMTLEHRQKLSDAKKGRKISEEHKQKLHAGRRNSTNSQEHKNAVSRAKLGTKHTEEARKKISEKRSKNPNSVEIARKAGIKSAQMRPDNYSELQSQRIKLWWVDRKKNKGE